MESFLAPNLNAQVRSLCHPQRICSSPERHCDAAAQESPGRCVGRAIDFPIKPTERQSYTTHPLNPSFATFPADIARTSFRQFIHQFRPSCVRKMAEPQPHPTPIQTAIQTDPQPDPQPDPQTVPQKRYNNPSHQARNCCSARGLRSILLSRPTARSPPDRSQAKPLHPDGPDTQSSQDPNRTSSRCNPVLTIQP